MSQNVTCASKSSVYLWDVHTRYIQYKYTFLCKVFYKPIVYSYLMVCVRTAKDGWNKMKMWYTLLSQKRSVHLEVLLPLLKQPGEPSE